MVERCCAVVSLILCGVVVSRRSGECGGVDERVVVRARLIVVWRVNLFWVVSLNVLSAEAQCALGTAKVVVEGNHEQLL